METLKNRSVRALVALAALTLPAAALAGPVVITFDDPVVTPGAGVYNWDQGKDGTIDMRFVDLTGGGFAQTGPGLNQKFVNQPGLEGAIINGPEIRVDFISNFGSNQGIYGPFRFGYALSTQAYVPLAVTFSLYGENGNLLSAVSTSAYRRSLGGGGLSSFSEGFASLGDPPVRPFYALIDFNSQEFAGRYLVDNFGYVPEPMTWSMMLAGFGFVGSALRRRQRHEAALSAETA